LAWIKIFLQLFNLFIDLGEAAELMLTALDFLLSGTSVQNVCQRSQGTWLLEFVFFIALTAPKILELVC
jgi:hypothetical protein